jgi:hypothetical protein
VQSPKDRWHTFWARRGPLHNYRLIWRVLDEKGKSLSRGERMFDELIDAVPVSAALPPDADGHAFRLTVTLLSPTGLVVAEETLEWPPQRPAGQQ